jgi:hypothetical protein
MIHTARALQLEYLLDTDGTTQSRLDAIEPTDREATVTAGIEHARRMTQLHAPDGKAYPGAKWTPAKTHGCCADADCSGPKGLYEHCKSAEHVAAEFGLKPGAADAVGAVAGLMHRAKLSYRLPDDLEEAGLKGLLLTALNDSWRRTYRNAASPVFGATASNDDSPRAQNAQNSQSQVFAKRIQMRSAQSAMPSLGSSPMPMRRAMVPG